MINHQYNQLTFSLAISSLPDHKMDDEDILFLLHQEEQAKSLSETWKQEEEAFQKAVEEYVHTSTTEVKPSVVLLPTKSSPEEKKKNKKKPMINIQIVPKTKQNQSLQTKESSMKNNQHQDSKLLQTFTSAEERKRTRDSEFHSSVIEGPSIKRMKSSTHDNESSNNHKSVSADIPSSTSNPSQTQSSTSDFSKEIPENDNTTALVNYTLDDTD
jgi:hypothetical protein